MKVVDADSAAVLMTLFVEGGRTLETTVPLGRAKIKYATGRVWYGEVELFGADTQYSETDKVFEFARDDRGVQGYTVELIKQVGGNLRTNSIGPSDF